jgi:uncharacterized protein (TIGR03435 family)
MTSWLPALLANHLWQSTLFVALVWLVTLALRRHDARLRYWLWAAASVKFFLPFSWLISLGALVEWRTAPTIAQPAATFVMQQILAPPLLSGAVPQAPQDTNIGRWVVLGVWLAGTGVVFFWWGRQWRPLRSALRRATPLLLGPDCDAGGLTVMSSPSAFEPGVVGILRPVLLLPEGLVDRLTRVQLETILAHERAHVRAHDNLLAVVHMVVEAIFWFHPLVWWIERRIIDERERACDEAVLRAGSRPEDYAEGILIVCRFSFAAPLTCVAGITGSDLRRRIEFILHGEARAPMTFAKRIVIVVGGLAILVAPVVVGAVRAPRAADAAERQGGQTVTGPQEFEVASVRPNVSVGPGRMGVEFFPGGRVRATWAPLILLIAVAYDVPIKQIDARAVALSTRVDVDARAGANALSPDAPAAERNRQLRLMLQSLLRDRFKLAIHTEMREMPLYALVLANNGPRLKTSPPDRACLEEPCGRVGGGSAEGLRGRDAEISSLAEALGLFLDRDVVDRTGLQGRFDIDLPAWRHRDDAFNGQSRGDSPDPSIFTLIEEQLGLRLEPTRGPRMIYVVDSVAAPAPD